MMNVKQLLDAKGRKVFSVSPEATVYEALELMADKNIGAVIVLHDERVVGLFSERDYARKVILQGKSSKTSTIGELMTRDVLYVQPEDSLDDCMSLMTQKRIRHIPVLENDLVTGMISIGDVVRAVISSRESTIQQLERYITGSYG